jgi:GrpB-like predicted nucleotidyltransferase (UPF0157 family)/GNAT superfamily N-acetyltransferase
MSYHSQVKVVPYNSNWPEIFIQESHRIEQEIKPHLKRTYHIGSTSIPNLAAKPVIDILLECENLDDIGKISTKLIKLGYLPVRRSVVPHRSFFTKRFEGDISFNLHIREQGDPQIQRHVNFPLYLIQHPEIAKKYAELKIKLAQHFANDIDGYVSGKDQLVQEIDAKVKQWAQRPKNLFSQQTGIEAKYWPKDKILKAMEANLNVEMTHFAQYLPQVELVRIPGYTLINSGLPDDTFNCILEADFSAEEVDKKIDEIVKKISKMNLPFCWWVCPLDKPENIIQHLEKAGFKNTENNIGMYLDLDQWQAPKEKPAFEIVRAKSKDELQDFANVLVNDEKSFQTYFAWIADILTEEDPIEFYVGYVDGKPVTRGKLVFYAQVAGIYYVSTAHDERRKGYATMMENFLLSRAKELGFHIAVLSASPEGLGLYQKLGFEECGVFKEFKLL